MAAGDPCELCRTPVPPAPHERAFGGEVKRFCCAGCLNVYSILVESGAVTAGLDLRDSDLFKQSLSMGLIASPEAAPRVLPEDAETREEVYHLSGMWCTSCGWLVEHALGQEFGVRQAEVLFTSDLLKVKVCPQYLPPGRIAGKVAALGYTATAYGLEREGDRKAWQDLLLRLGLAFGLWMNVMLFSLVVYASYFERIAEGARVAVPLILLGLSLPAVTYSAWPIHRLAWYGFRQGRLRMETLISTGVLAAFGYSVAQVFLGGQHYYFDTACAIVTLVLLGKALERSAKERSAQAIAMLHRLLPRKARIQVEGEERFVAVEALQPGMTFLVKAGERIPADGTVLSGASSVDESVVTGESVPRPRGPGDRVVCGALNGAGVLSVRVSHASADSTLAQIVKAVEGALANRSPLERSVDRVARLFIPAVLGLAAATAAGCVIAGLPLTEGLMRAIAVMVIACPCALGIATPLATTAAVGAASRRGILIRDVATLETFQAVTVVLLDKTGTVTEGRFKVREAEVAHLDLVASLEAYSEHPIGQALAVHARETGIALADAEDVRIHQGAGIAGTVLGRRVLAGSRRLLEAEGVAVPQERLDQAEAWQEQGLTSVYAAVDGACCGVLALGDRPRASAEALIRSLQARGIRVALLSGDAAATTRRVAESLGMDEALGEVPPGGKAEVVQRFQKEGGVVAMVGDGINDAPALAAADLGIAMGSGADLAMHAAPVVLLGDQLGRIEETFWTATRTLRVIRQNLFWAFFYNAAGISLAATGILNPILAAGAMVLSSLSVIGNSLRLNGKPR